MKADIAMLAGLLLTALGMAVTIIGVIAPGFFFPGVYLLGLGLAACAVGGVLHVVLRKERA